jgi:hypothetical protein
VLLANVVEMGDDQGGYKAANTAFWRDYLHAATIIGRMASAREAVELGYAITPDAGPSGRLGHWAIAGIPKGAQEVHSKRSAEIDAEMERQGFDSYQARGVAACETRKAKRHTPVEELMPYWRGELAAAGYAVRDLNASIEKAAAERDPLPHRMVDYEHASAAERALDPDGDLASRKIFSRRDVIVAVGPSLYGREPIELERLVERVLRDPEAVPLLAVPGASEQPYATATTIAREDAIAERVAEGMSRRSAAVCDSRDVSEAVSGAEARIGAPLSWAQRVAAEDIATSGRDGAVRMRPSLS